VTNAVQPNKAWGVPAPARATVARPRVATEGDCAPRYTKGGKGACINGQPCRVFGVRADGGRAICVCFGRDGGCAGGQRCGLSNTIQSSAAIRAGGRTGALRGLRAWTRNACASPALAFDDVRATLGEQIARDRKRSHSGAPDTIRTRDLCLRRAKAASRSPFRP
jgi:hypothetical protein